MKPVHYLLVAAFALVLGCQAQETLNSKGTNENSEIADNKGATTGETKTTGETPEGGVTGMVEAPSNTDAGATGSTKPEEPAKNGETANDPGVTMQTLVGDYDGKLFEETIKFLMSMAPEDKRKEVEAELRGAVIKLALNKDGTYAMTTKSKDKQEVNKGKWSYDAAKGVATLDSPEITDEQKARLKAQGVTDEMIAAQKKEAIACQVSNGGKTLTFEENKMGMKNGITFTRK